MVVAKPSLRRIHYHGLISLQPNTTSWITRLSFSVKLYWHPCISELLVISYSLQVQTEIIVVTGDLCALLEYWKIAMCFMWPYSQEESLLSHSQIKKTCHRTQHLVSGHAVLWHYSLWRTAFTSLIYKQWFHKFGPKGLDEGFLLKAKW